MQASKVLTLIAAGMCVCAAVFAEGLALFITGVNDWPTMEVVVMIGQSNMSMPNTTTNSLGVLCRNTNAPPYYYYRTAAHYGDEAYENKFDAVLPVSPARTNAWGPEITFGDALRADGRRFCIFKIANIGASLDDDWEKGNFTGMQLYHIMQEKWPTIRQRLYTQYHYRPYVRAFVMFQGETDAKTLASANAYEANLTNLIYSMRRDFGTNAHFFITRIARDVVTNNFQYISTIRAAQTNVAQSVYGCSFINTDDLAHRTAEDVHLSADGCMDYGYRVASNYMEVCP